MFGYFKLELGSVISAIQEEQKIELVKTETEIIVCEQALLGAWGGGKGQIEPVTVVRTDCQLVLEYCAAKLGRKEHPFRHNFFVVFFSNNPFSR